MTQLKARLVVVLKADEVVVAESDDALLWQRVLKAINSGASDLRSEAQERTEAARENNVAALRDAGLDGQGGDRLADFAGQLGLPVNLVKGACDPSESEPYLHLDMHNWSAVKSQLPKRGALALSPIVVASTLLGLWSRVAGLPNPTQAQAQKVLATINVIDKNPSRGIKGATWLQARAGGQVLINAAHIERAILLGKCFCSKDWSPWKGALADA